MIIEQIIGNTEDVELGNRRVEVVYMRSDDLVKRVQRVETDCGTELGIRLGEPRDLRDGDILYADGERTIVLRVLPDRLLVIRPQSIGQMGFIAHQIGNRHVPAQFEGDTMLVQYDRLLAELLNQHGIPFTDEERAVRQAFRPIGHSHDHAPGHAHGVGRSHDHDHGRDDGEISPRHGGQARRRDGHGHDRDSRERALDGRGSGEAGHGHGRFG